MQFTIVCFLLVFAQKESKKRGGSTKKGRKEKNRESSKESVKKSPIARGYVLVWQVLVAESMSRLEARSERGRAEGAENNEVS